MAQEVHFFDDRVKFTEGPFVICKLQGSGWRIEVELKRFKCPVLPHDSISKIMRKLGLDGKTDDKALAERVCDKLNRMVAEGEIVLVGKCWLARDAA